MPWLFLTLLVITSKSSYCLLSANSAARCSEVRCHPLSWVVVFLLSQMKPRCREVKKPVTGDSVEEAELDFYPS